MLHAHLSCQTERDTQWREFIVAMVCHLMNASGNMNTPVKPSDILGTGQSLEDEMKEKAEMLRKHRDMKEKKAQTL